MPSVRRKSFVFSPSSLLLCLAAATFVVSWVLVASAGYLGLGLYRDYLDLREENARLIKKNSDEDKLKLNMERIQENETLIRNVLGLERNRALEGVRSQGGMPTWEPPFIPLENSPESSGIQSIPEVRSRSILDQAKSLEEGLQELIEAMRERQQILDSTPSIVPVKTEDYWFSSVFGWRRSPFTGQKEFHDGLDISAPYGTPIIAPGQGRVIEIGHHRYRGKYLILDHGGQRFTTYGHLSRLNVTRDQEVERGQVIAYMGNSGRSTGSHLHYEIEVNGSVVNPKHYILNAKASRLLEIPFQSEVNQQ
jgi:murein DD-endopeptidase MepM/ murein hydrolase activator NlpD